MVADAASVIELPWSHFTTPEERKAMGVLVNNDHHQLSERLSYKKPTEDLAKENERKQRLAEDNRQLKADEEKQKLLKERERAAQVRKRVEEIGADIKQTAEALTWEEGKILQID